MSGYDADHARGRGSELPPHHIKSERLEALLDPSVGAAGAQVMSPA